MIFILWIKTMKRGFTSRVLKDLILNGAGKRKAIKLRKLTNVTKEIEIKMIIIKTVMFLIIYHIK